MKPMYIEVEGFDAITKTAHAAGSACGIYLPKSWIGKTVKAIMLKEDYEPITKFRDPKLEKHKFQTWGYAILEKTIKKGGNMGIVYLPKSWLGKTVKIILLEDIKEEEIRV